MTEKKYVLKEYFRLCDGGVCEDLLEHSEKLQMKNDGVMFLTGILQRADEENGNGRIYPKLTLEREVNNYQKLINDNMALGELDHPEDDSVINLKNASHVVTKVWWNGNDVMGKIRILNTPSGNILKSLVKDGITLGISSRALGSVKESKGRTVVEDDLQLICFDMVSNPSTSNAFMHLSEIKRPNLNKSQRLHNILKDILE